jgi:2-(1,2-epoxy-1,2-dihydrophenyl)acetyl-CoA isomerase
LAYDYVLHEIDGGIATITLNRPDRLNALYGTMREEIVDALARSTADPAVRAVIVTGAGRGFCAGGDIGYMAGLIEKGDETAFRALVAAGAAVVREVRASPKPVVAAVNGAAAGGGMNLALACDLRIAASEAVFSQAFVKIGMHPDWGGMFLLPRLVGSARALELMLTGRAVKADEALAMGIVNRVVPGAELMAETRRLAEALAAGPPLAMAAIKRNVYRSLDLGLDAVLEQEIEAQIELFRSADALEGMSAFQEKRKAMFRGV